MTVTPKPNHIIISFDSDVEAETLYKVFNTGAIASSVRQLITGSQYSENDAPGQIRRAIKIARPSRRYGGRLRNT
jgi:hypothetical protein